jgi:hypothetical protein
MKPEARGVAEALILLSRDSHYAYLHDAQYRVQIDALAELLVPITADMTKAAFVRMSEAAAEKDRLSRTPERLNVAWDPERGTE